ncbi:MAG: ankyrin-2-like, partial [Planctomycetaceae bacterium]|nr:ankyrin-2-like [Planctomycetaceae bacterium]
VVQVLIDAGANVNAKNLNGDTPLGLAQRMKSPELVEQLTAKAAEDGQTEFSRAVVRGDVARVKELIASGTPVDQTGPGKKCALHFASESNQLEMARALIGAKADVNCQDVEGLSPLHLATSKAMGQILLDAGARIDPQPKSPHGSPLSRLATQGRRDVVELLLQRAKTAVPNDVVAMVTYYGQVDVLQVLLERGASPNATLSDIGPSALEIATTGALADTSCPETVTPEIRLKMVKLLTKFEADVNVPSQFDGHTPLHAAAERGETEMVKLLLQYEADPNAAPIGKGFAGLTPLHLAAKNGHSVAAGVLLDAGADVNVSTHETKGKEPRTAVDFALSKVLREMLIKRGGKSFAELGK